MFANDGDINKKDKFSIFIVGESPKTLTTGNLSHGIGLLG